jgi:hypothetical protein
VVVIRGSAVRPAGDLVQCEVTREAASDVLGWLRAEGVYDEGSVVVTDVAAAPSVNARATERAAPGAPDDAIVWDAVVDNAYGEARGSWSFYAFLTLATTIAAVAVVTDSAILVVGGWWSDRSSEWSPPWPSDWRPDDRPSSRTRPARW